MGETNIPVQELWLKEWWGLMRERGYMGGILWYKQPARKKLRSQQLLCMTQTLSTCMYYKQLVCLAHAQRMYTLAKHLTVLY